MRLRLLSAVSLAIAAAVGLWLLFSKGAPGIAMHGAVRTADASARSSMAWQGPSAPMAASAKVVSHLPSQRAGGPVPLSSQIFLSHDLRDLLNQVRADSTLAPREQLLAEALIYERCARYGELAAQAQPRVMDAIRNEKVDDLAERIGRMAKSDRQRDALKANLQGRIAYVCRNFASEPIGQDEVERAFAAAAQAGSPTAQARMIEKRMADSGIRNAPQQPDSAKDSVANAQAGYPDPITPDENAVLLRALFSEDPVAIREAGEVLSIGSDRQSLRVGADLVDLGPHADETWTLAACQFGFECGASNANVSNACASRVQCADDYETYLRDYALTSQEFAQVQSNARLIADAIARHDYSAFTLASTPGTVRTAISVTQTVRVH